MSEKYIDLASDIASTYRIDRGVTDYVLHALDQFIADHPDQVPGRTITRSTMLELISEHFYTPVREIDVEAYTEALGRLVVPDPELTNVEKLQRLQREWVAAHPVSGGMGLIEYLDMRGVKAGGDDDQ